MSALVLIVCVPLLAVLVGLFRAVRMDENGRYHAPSVFERKDEE